MGVYARDTIFEERLQEELEKIQLEYEDEHGNMRVGLVKVEPTPLGWLKSPRTNDKGVDLIIELPNKRRIAAQVKGYNGNNKVGSDAVLKVHGGKNIPKYNCQESMVITASSYTKEARETAKELGCTLIDKDNIEYFVRGVHFIFSNKMKVG